MRKSVLVDTGYWIAFFDPREPDHDKVIDQEDLIESLTVVVPWPILYETLRTRFVRRSDWIIGLNERLKKPNVYLIDDRDYCEKAYDLSVEYSIRRRRPISMVDMLCRLLIEDLNIRIDCLLTTNHADFVDVCPSYRVEML